MGPQLAFWIQLSDTYQTLAMSCPAEFQKPLGLRNFFLVID